MLKKTQHTPTGYIQIKQHNLTSTLHEILPSLTPQNKPQILPISLV